MVSRTWTVTVHYVPEGEWSAFACEVDFAEADQLTAITTSPSGFGGGSSPYNAACEALAPIMPEEDGPGCWPGEADAG